MTEHRPKGASPRILVVDDNDDNVYTLKLHLDLEGYTDVETARDGEEAIARLKTDSFDLVLLDVMMPKVDGFQVLTWLKDQTRLRDLPVIMISALTELNSMARCIELGAVDYLLKPFNPVLLKARLGATLEKHLGDCEACRQALDAAPDARWEGWLGRMRANRHRLGSSGPAQQPLPAKSVSVSGDTITVS